MEGMRTLLKPQESLGTRTHAAPRAKLVPHLHLQACLSLSPEGPRAWHHSPPEGPASAPPALSFAGTNAAVPPAGSQMLGWTTTSKTSGPLATCPGGFPAERILWGTHQSEAAGTQGAAIFHVTIRCQPVFQRGCSTHTHTGKGASATMPVPAHSATAQFLFLPTGTCGEAHTVGAFCVP